MQILVTETNDTCEPLKTSDSEIIVLQMQFVDSSSTLRMVCISMFETCDQIVDKFVEPFVGEVLRRYVNFQIWVTR